MKFTEQQISIVARSLSDSAASECGIDKDDAWNIYSEQYLEEAEAALAVLSAAAPQVVADERPAVVYPPDGTVSPFTVINLGHGLVKMGDSLHDGRLPALWFGKDGLGMGVAEEMNRAAKEGETLAVVTFSNVDGLDVLAEVVQRIRSVAFPAAPVQAQEPVLMTKQQVIDAMTDNNLLTDNGRMALLNGDSITANLEFFTQVINFSALMTIRAPVQPVAVPDGWKLVPVEPTDEMRMATIHSTYHYEIDADWAAMLAAAPAAPAAQGDAQPFKWPNGCDRTIPKALRYLARNDRPSGGEDIFNGMHLLQLADEMDAAVQRAAIAAKAAS